MQRSASAAPSAMTGGARSAPSARTGGMSAASGSASRTAGMSAASGRTAGMSATSGNATNAGEKKMTVREINKAASDALGPRQQASSALVSSAKYSFAMPKHRKGTFKIPVLDPRCAEYKPGIKEVPEAGAYEIASSLGRHDNNRGHPEYKRAPGYSFGARTEPRECIDPHPAPVRKRFSALSHVKSDSFLDVPGPGAYLGVNETHHANGLAQLPTKNKQPAYTMRPKCGRSFGTVKGEGPGPFEYDTRKKQVVLGRKQPEYSISRQAKKPFELSLGTEDHIGPGTYQHATAML